MNDIFVIDDVISKENQDLIEKLMFNQQLDWKFFKDIALNEKEMAALGVTKYTPAIACYFKQENPPYELPKFYDALKFLPTEALAKAGLELTKIFDARSFLSFPLHPNVRKEYDNIHVDMPADHWVCLYYVNDIDGDTTLFKQRVNIEIKTIDEYQRAEWEPLQSVSPKKGRAVVFKGNRYHSSTGPTNGVRCILNFDVEVK